MLPWRRKFLRANEGAIALGGETRSLPGSYHGRGGNFFKEIYDADHGDQTHGGRFRWMLSTCLAATVGAIAILVVVYGSSDQNSGSDGLLPALISIRDGTMPIVGAGAGIYSFINLHDAAVATVAAHAPS